MSYFAMLCLVVLYYHINSILLYSMYYCYSTGYCRFDPYPKYPKMISRGTAPSRRAISGTSIGGTYHNIHIYIIYYYTYIRPMQGLNLREFAPISVVLYGTVPLSIWGCWFFISAWSPVRGAFRKVALIVSVKAVGFILSKWDENWWLKSFAMAWNRNSIFFLFSFLIPVTGTASKRRRGAAGVGGGPDFRWSHVFNARLRAAPRCGICQFTGQQGSWWLFG